MYTDIGGIFMAISKRDNFLKAVRFERPDYIPMIFAINGACWNHYDNEALYDLMEGHKHLFPDFVRPNGKLNPTFDTVNKKGVPYKDSFGCIWETTDDGITGTVTKHPLSNWSDFKNYTMPDPHTTNGLEPFDWDSEIKLIEQLKQQGHLTQGGLRHGHTFLQLTYIRGYEDLIFDMTDEEPELPKLIDMLEAFNMEIIMKYVKAGVDLISYPEDLGMQVGPMLSPDQFRQYIKPSYKRLMKPAIDSGALVHMHSDGDLHDLIDDMMGSGIDIINLQDLVNGIDWIADRFSQKVCVDLDIDRQSVTLAGTPKEIDALIKEEVTKIASRQGGLTMIYGLYPGIPLENVKALMDAMEKYSFYFD